MNHDITQAIKVANYKQVKLLKSKYSMRKRPVKNCFLKKEVFFT